MNYPKLRSTAIITFIVAFVLVIIGAWMKITHQPFADILLSIGLVAEGASVLMLIVMAFRKNPV